MADGYLNFDTKIDTSGFEKGTDNISKEAKSASSDVASAIDASFKKIGRSLAAVFSVRAIVSFGKEALEASAGIKAANSQLSQTFGELEGTARQAMKRVADASGIVDTRLHSVGTGIYAFAKTAGMDTASAMKMMEDSLQVAADSAAYYDRSLEETSETLKSFLKGNYANDAALGLSATETTRNAAANKLYGKSFQELSEAQKQLTLLQMVKDANALSGAEGQAAREADGWENVLGNLKESWRQLLGVVGQPILSAAVTVVQHLTEWLSYLTDAARTAGQAIADVFGVELASSSQAVSASTKQLSSNAGSAASSYEQMAEAAEDAEKANENQLASFDQITKLGSGSSENSSGSSPAAPITVPPVTVPIETDLNTAELTKRLKSIFKTIKKHFNSFKSWFGSSFGDIFSHIWDGLVRESEELGQTLSGIWADIQSLAEPLKTYFAGDFTAYLQQAFTTLGNIAVGLFDTFNMVFSDIWNVAVFPILQKFITDGLPVLTQFGTEMWATLDTAFAAVKTLFDVFWSEGIVPVLDLISEIIGDIFEDIHAFWAEWGQPIFDAVREAIEQTGELLLALWDNFISPVIDSVIDGLETIWDEHLRPLVQEFLDFVGVLAQGALDIYNEFIAPVVKWLVEKLGPVFSKVFDLIWDKVSTVIGGIIDIIKSVITVLKGVVEFISGVFTGNWRKAWNGIKDIFGGIWDALVTVIKTPLNLIIGAINKMLEAIESAVNWVIDGINELSFEVPDWVPVIGGETFGFDLSYIDIPTIPELAKGTVVPANYGEFLAVLGDNKHEAEVVSPLSTIRQAVMEALVALNGTGSPDSAPKQPATIVIQIDKKTVGRAVIEDINEYTKRNGKSPLNA